MLKIFIGYLQKKMLNQQLKKEIKMKKIHYILFMASCILSCGSLKNIDYEENIHEYINKNYSTYSNIRKQLEDEVSFKIDHKLQDYIGLSFKTGFKIDELILFNTSNTKLFTTLNSLNSSQASGSSDLVQGLYGIKIKNKWHIYLGANCIAMREGYKYNKYEPFTWEELSFVAHDNFFRKYIAFDSKGRVIINHDKVDEYATPWNIGGTAIEHNGTEEENFIKLTEYFESRKIDSVEYQELLDEIYNPEPKKKDPIYKVSWWDKLWGAEVPIFETKEWKEFIKENEKK